jgi:P pilus assembly chaperone PapD
LFKFARKIGRLSVLAVCVFTSLQAPLAEAGTIRINPTKIRLVISPGDSKSGAIEVENSTDEPLRIKAYTQDWRYTPLQNGTKEFFPAATLPLSCSDWVVFSPTEFTIPAYGRQRLSYTVKVPLDAEGGHYTVLFFETLLHKPDNRDASSVGVMIRIGALFYIEPQGTVRREAEVSALKVARTSKDQPLSIGLNFKNTGNVDLTASGTFHVMDQGGMIFARGEFDDIYTFPGNAAAMSTQWKEPLGAGAYDLVLTLDIGKASEEAGLERGPVITRDASLEIGDNGDVVKIGELK